MKSLFCRVSFAAFLLGAAPAWSQLQITEIMYNPSTPSDGFYEWFEVVNTGTEAIDLDGTYIEDFAGFARADFLPAVQSALASNTVIQPGQVAVLYDAFVGGGSPYNYDDAAFRAAWNIPETAATIAVDFFPSLNNSNSAASAGNNSNADTIGFWASQADLALDTVAGVIDANGTTVNAFNNTYFNFSYKSGSGWPASTNGVSIELIGSDVNAGASWALSANGVNGATTSNEILDTSAGFKNSTDDFGSPGQVQTAGTPPVGLHFSEIMYNPASGEPAWEWVEVYNATGAAIDFGATPYVFDDNDDADLAAANLTSGTIANGSAAVLYNASETGVSLADMQTAWGASVNFIPVTEWTALTQGGDGIALWDSYAAYTSEPTTGQGRTFDNAIESIDYGNAEFGWPDDNGTSSIYLTDLTNANATVAVAPAAGDFNGDGLVDAADYTVWRDTEGTGDLRADANGDQVIDGLDYDLWVANYGTITEQSAGPFWALSGSDFNDFISTQATAVPTGGQAVVYAGGEVGSPGVYNGTSLAVSVPEPSSVLLALVALAGLAKRRG
ncbi:hypothetical protein Pla108_27850 [Botrimarina colliarenosi]|uniref:LTD domain-containing protein n=1 Tax=Botrimarina colliarenosi TaxID=2528001 RepID=A0A5C6ACG0_9BACT|nr:lamin tail domain-containing protein [Botrimarina colliarenosi]TWT97008.1 hypothetical protein Pla108_27850 [Botrimarina colliarenosi]